MYYLHIMGNKHVKSHNSSTNNFGVLKKQEIFAISEN